MDDLIKLVKTYRFTAQLSDRLLLADEIFELIEPGLRLFVFGRAKPDAAEDALQEVLKGIASGLKQFKGGTDKEFWAWCYGIASHKLADHYQRQAAERMLPLPPDELWQLMDVSAQDAPLTAQTRHDLEYALNLLTAAKPECRDYLWQHYVFGLDYSEIAEERKISYDNARMKIGRCLEEVRNLVA